jgi:hypothetical protein
MTELVITVSDPDLRGFAETALEFVWAVYKDEVLADLGYVFVTSAYSEGDARRMVEEAKRGLPEEALASVRFVAERYVAGNGAYYRRQPKYVAIAMAKDMYSFLTLSHEIAHHAFYADTMELTRALRMDVPELDELVMRALMTSEEAEKKAVDLAGWVIFFVDEYVAEYVAVNYFQYLHTGPDTDPRDFAEYLALNPITVAYGNLARALDKLEELERYAELRDLARAIARKLEEGELHGFVKAIHTFMSRKVKRWPRDVYLSNPSRYGVLCEEWRWRVLV